MELDNLAWESGDTVGEFEKVKSNGKLDETKNYTKCAYIDRDKISSTGGKILINNFYKLSKTFTDSVTTVISMLSNVNSNKCTSFVFLLYFETLHLSNIYICIMF